MPKTKLSDYEQKKLVARTTIKNRLELRRIGKEILAPKLHCSERTVQRRWAHPETLRLDDLWTLTDTLRLSDTEILQIVRGEEIK